METNNSVEWQLVDYGSGVFHVASYQEGAEQEAPSAAPIAADVPVVRQEPAVSGCIFYRCWTAMCDGRRAS